MKTKKLHQMFQPSARFLPLQVYQFPLGNCGGITDYPSIINSKPPTVYIPCEEGHLRYDEIDTDFVFIPEKRSNTYWALIPNEKQEHLMGPTAGGNLAYSSDSRCKHVYHIHDRFETQREYNTLST